ncbi:sensor histidine kinase [Streptomyces tsukubensis]|uniref:histidine kinase n=1 Tax=Streptomyces tsukubensis TaxID=83656 RepID=A0A1V4ACK4_9ACTN|nr:sensor histidine kinase [Streptomyces tsukubensis]OON81424.1 two-component sensor histidine kinase [Streptomyces tsukubensis]QFR95446.1 HAMP domain-containing protein [Streptomyces tsukubensis]
MRWPRRLRPHSLRTRLVLIAGLLATSAVLLCQLAGLAVLRGWLTDQVDDRLAHFRPPDHAYEDIAGKRSPRPPRPDNALPSDYRVFFYGEDGSLLRTSLGSRASPVPQLPEQVDDLELTDRRPSTVPAADGAAGSGWRVIAYSGPDHMRAVVALRLNTVDGATTKLLWLSLGLGVAVAAGVVALGNGAVRLGLRPLHRVERTAQHITEGALELNVPVADPDTEVGRLALALNTMLDRLRTALHRTESSEQRLRHFMADAGHELRTPLTAIQGFAELLLAHPGMSGRRREEAHALIAHNADRMSRLVDDLFLLAKVGDTPTAHRQPVDLLSLAADAIATTAIRHPGRAITLEPLTTCRALPDSVLDPGAAREKAAPEKAAPETDPGTCPETDPGCDLDVIEAAGDPHQLAQVIGNLLSNACTHTPADSRVRVRVGATRVPSEGGEEDGAEDGDSGSPLPAGTPVCVVEVADTGPGIAPDEAAHVFDRFYRATPLGGPPTARGSEPGPEPGTGLGLAIAAAIAGAHGGRLELDNHPGAGCTFRLLLPESVTVPRDEPTT